MQRTGASNNNASRAVSPVPQQPIDFPAPTLRVMRLQKPALHMATPGCTMANDVNMLGSALCLPESLTVYIGENFTAYLGIINSSLEYPLRRVTVSAQLQTPSQRRQMPSHLEQGSDVGPNGNVDAIVAHAIEESGQHILRVEVGYTTPDNASKTFRKFYRFLVVNPLQMRIHVTRIGDSKCYASLNVEYASSDPNEKYTSISISNIDFICADGLTAKRVSDTPSNSATDNNTSVSDISSILNDAQTIIPGSKLSVLFEIESTSPDAVLRGIAGGDYIGQARVIWSRSMGEKGQSYSEYLYCPLCDPDNSNFLVYRSGFSVDVAAQASQVARNPTEKLPLLSRYPVTVEPINPPTEIELLKPVDVQFLVVNHSENEVMLQLQFRLPSMHPAIIVNGSSFQSLGPDAISGRGGSKVVTVSLIAVHAGLSRVQGCVVVDQISGLEVVQPPLFEVFVTLSPQHEDDTIIES